ncbi:hypothetical protein BV25DRAFT_1799161 [Artomyces pyxidatus]|uniref:Uncharacterized protein n=1 Tax=Artomyces pyxidatus TaxID=48021 RepID=A0ACB8T8C9_9AGAM|nr:hypothetical protein BV25DRAFT_1799161 [Artomyces pyxidatus]
MDVNESTVKGNSEAIQCLLRQGGVGDPTVTPGVVDVSEYVVIFHGDLGTLERVQSLQQSRGIEKSPWLQFRYIVFIPGFFHLKMACADAIWRAFVKPKKSRLDPTSTMEHAGIFRPQETGIIGSNPGFRRMHDLTQHDGIIRRLDCWRVEVQRRTSSAAMTLDDFAAMKPTWEDIEAMSYDLVTRYVASGDFSRAGSASERDQDFENSLLRNQCYLLYEEITYAMNAGDVGRLEIALATWILVFKGTGKNKYAAQMTKFLLEVNFLYPERLRRAVRMNWFCNPKGQAGAFRGVDWLVERNNLYTKHIYGGQFSNNTIPYILKESVLIELYRKLHVNIEDNFCLTGRAINHAPPNMTATFGKVADHIANHAPHEFRAGRKVKYEVDDTVRKGAGLMMIGPPPTSCIEAAQVEDDGESGVSGGVESQDLAV